MNPAVDPVRFAPGMARQLVRLREALADGMPRRGWKIGINVPEVRRQLDLPHSVVGWIDGRRVFSTGAVLAPSGEARLLVEPELAVSLAALVPAGCSPASARSLIADVRPALEIVDYAKPTSGLDDLVAQCMFHDATVLGPSASLDAARDLGSAYPVLRVGGRSSDPPRGDLVPADPGELVAFVASYLAAFGESLEPGDLVLSGSYTARAVEIHAGEEAVAEFGDLGSVSARVAS